eukprot:scaffold2101_cov98-Isochrysis_galbana.AAC.5
MRRNPVPRPRPTRSPLPCAHPCNPHMRTPSQPDRRLDVVHGAVRDPLPTADRGSRCHPCRRFRAPARLSVRD